MIVLTPINENKAAERSIDINFQTNVEYAANATIRSINEMMVQTMFFVAFLESLVGYMQNNDIICLVVLSKSFSMFSLLNVNMHNKMFFSR